MHTVYNSFNLLIKIEALKIPQHFEKQMIWQLTFNSVYHLRTAQPKE